jgi:peroxiredoxin Q/BCP
MSFITRCQFLGWLLALPLLTQTSRANPDDFTVRGVTSTNVFQLSAAKGRFVALHFLLKTECPYCLRYTREYAQKSAGAAQVIQVFLKPDTEAEIKAWAAKLGEDPLDVTVYRDPDAALAKAYHIPDGYKFHGQTVHYPALVLLDAKGKEVFRYVGKSNADRLAYEKFTAKLKELTAPPTK